MDVLGAPARRPTTEIRLESHVAMQREVSTPSARNRPSGPVLSVVLELGCGAEEGV